MTFLKVNNRPVRSFDGLLNDLFSNFENFPGQPATNDTTPVNILETVEGYHLELSAPGRQKEQFKLQVEKNILTISYESLVAEPQEAPKEQKQIRKEFSTAGFKRSFTLDEKVNADGIQAKYEEGLLKVFVPRKEEVKPAVKEITIG